MKIMKTAVVPQTKRVIVDRVTCDFCGADIDQGNFEFERAKRATIQFEKGLIILRAVAAREQSLIAAQLAGLKKLSQHLKRLGADLAKKSEITDGSNKPSD